jgi:ABC-type sugar transport system ATPase subunit
MPLLRLEGLTKRFHGVHALEGASFAVQRGTIHAVVGENGAGKSTLMKLLVGIHAPDGGRIVWEEQAVTLDGPAAARAMGIDIVFQEIELAPNLTVGESIFLAREPSRWGWVDAGEVFRCSARLLASLGVAIRPDARIEDLSVAEKQLVQIARALAGETRLLILDEPTSALTEHESRRLFEILEELRRRGTTLLYVSHKLEEIFRLADTITVLRDGRHVGTFPRQELDADALIRHMVGPARELSRANSTASPPSTRRGGPEAEIECDVERTRPRHPRPDEFATPPPPDTATPLLAVRGLTRLPAFADVSFDVGRGEVVGFFGIVGAGRTELARALFGLDPFDYGNILIEGRLVRFRSPSAAVAAGLGLVPEDRKLQGLILEMSLRRNLSLAALPRLATAGIVRGREERRLASEAVARLGIVASGLEQEVRDLSGGNQQKVVIARWLATRPRLLILDEPTRGIDIAAKREVHALIRRLAVDGMGVLLISSELEEVLGLSDRLLVLREGRLAGEFDPRSALPETVLRAAVG